MLVWLHTHLFVSHIAMIFFALHITWPWTEFNLLLLNKSNHALSALLHECVKVYSSKWLLNQLLSQV